MRRRGVREEGHHRGGPGGPRCLARRSCPPCPRCELAAGPNSSLFTLRESVTALPVVATDFAVSPDGAEASEVFELFQASTMASIAAQSDESFVWLVLTHERTTPAGVLARLRSALAPYRNAHVLDVDRTDDPRVSRLLGKPRASTMRRTPHSSNSTKTTNATTTETMVYAWTTVRVGVALHRCAVSYLKSTLGRQYSRRQSLWEGLVGWGAIREWIGTDESRLGSIRSVTPSEMPARFLDPVSHGASAASPNVVTRVTKSLAEATKDVGSIFSRRRWRPIREVNRAVPRTALLVRYFPVRFCHHAGADNCTDSANTMARGVDSAFAHDLSVNYNISLPSLGWMTELELASAPSSARWAVSPPERSSGGTTTTANGTTRDVTLIVQTTCERLWSLRVTCKRWVGEMVIVLFRKSRRFGCAKEIAGPECFSESRNRTAPVRLLQRFATAAEAEMPTLYPVNRLRNVGIEAATTTHVIVIDADFWPDSQLYWSLAAIAADPANDNGGKHAIIVPSFEVDPLAAVSSAAQRDKCQVARNCVAEFERAVPNTLRGLLACLETGNCYMFDDRRNPDGHSSTDIALWLDLQSDDSIHLRPLACVASPRYEPYFMFRKTADDGFTPRFDPAFTGYGKNKIAIMLHLRLAGYAFSVLARSFLTHVPHGHSSAKSIFLSSKHLGQDAVFKRHRIAMNSLFETLVASIDGAPPGAVRLPTCPKNESRQLEKMNKACRLSLLAKKIQALHPALAASADWKRRVLGYYHVRTYLRCS